jgi:uncharacterized protein YcaQ
MSKKCRAFSISRVGLEVPNNRKAFYSGWEAAMECMMNDESHLPVSEQSLVFRLRKRAEIRRQIQDRKSVLEGKPDRIADLLEEAANEIERLQNG